MGIWATFVCLVPAMEAWSGHLPELQMVWAAMLGAGNWTRSSVRAAIVAAEPCL